MKLYTSGPAKRILDVYHTGDWTLFKSGPVWFAPAPFPMLHEQSGQLAVDIPDDIGTWVDNGEYLIVDEPSSAWPRELVNTARSALRPLT